MNFGLIRNEKCVNAIVLDDSPTKKDIKNLVPDLCDEVVPLSEGFGIDDFYINGTWMKEKPKTAAQLREEAYETLIERNDGTDLLPWDGNAITVDQANKVYLEYAAEGNSKFAQIQELIAEAKLYIRELYPDK